MTSLPRPHRLPARSTASVAALGLATLVVGCAPLNPRPAFDATNAIITERSGLDAAWIRNEEDEARILARVREILKEPLTARRVAQIALLNNRGLHANLEELGVAQANLAASGLPSNPELEGFLGWPSERGREKKFEIEFGTDLLDLVVLPSRRRLARLELAQTKALAGEAVLRLAADAQVAFHELAALVEVEARQKVALDVEETLVEFAEARERAGNLSDLDLELHRAELAEARAEVALTAREIAVGRERLNALMGLWGPDTAWALAPPTDDLGDAPGDAATLESAALEQRFDLAAARAAVELLESTLRLQRKTRWLPAGVRAGARVEREEGNRVRLQGPEVKLQLPIFNPGRAESARLEALWLQAQRLREDLEVRARAEVRERVERVRSARELAVYWRETAIPQRARILDMTLQRYNMMLKGADHLLEAKKRAVLAEIRWIEARRDARVARVELALAAGGAVPPAERVEGVPRAEGRKQESNR